MEFAIGAAAAVAAGFFTNPIDVVKIRLQLQGELEARGSYKRIYRNTFHAAYQIARHEGILALQSGLVPALGFQMVLNGIRLGGYNLAKRYELTVNEAGQVNVVNSLLVSGGAGCVGSALASPLYLVKTQLQSQASGNIAVGTQHHHTGTWSALRTLWKEGGFRGLYRGWHVGVPRISVGSSTQLTSYSVFADWLKPFQGAAPKAVVNVLSLMMRKFEKRAIRVIQKVGRVKFEIVTKEGEEVYTVTLRKQSSRLCPGSIPPSEGGKF